jgi:hypothetical protein
VVSSSPHACCGGGYGDLTSVTVGLSDQVGRRTWATSREVSSAPMREWPRTSRRWAMPPLVSDEVVELFEGRPVSETPRTEASGESEVPRDPPVGGLGRGEDTG